MEPTFSPAWFATFGRPDPMVTEHEVDFLTRVLPQPPVTVLDVPWPDGTRDEFEWQLYEPEELGELGSKLGLRLDAVCADFDSNAAPSSETPRTQLVFRRDT